jgi:membrane-associated phospholipid phosphatase
MPYRTKLALRGALGGVVLLILSWYATFHIAAVDRADRTIYDGFASLGEHGRIHQLAVFLASLCNPGTYVWLAAIPVAIALIRHRYRLAATVTGILLAANVSTEVLKPLLAHPRADPLAYGPTPLPLGSWPSGHTTAAMSLALCLVLVAPARLRPSVAALGAAFTVAVVYSLLTIGAHYPSDVLGGFLVAATWTLLGLALLFLAEDRARRSELLSSEPVPTRSALGPPVATVLSGGVLAVVLVLLRPVTVATFLPTHRTFLVGALGIGALALALATGLMLALVRRVP